MAMIRSTYSSVVWLSLCITFAGGGAGLAQVQSGVALSSDGIDYLWDLTDGASPRRLTRALPDAVQPGICYRLENGTLVAENDKHSCLSYYVSDDLAQDPPRLSLSGRFAFNDRAPGLQYRGLELRNVAGVETCGERDNCETLYIVGFQSEALVDQAMRAARAGRTVTVGARMVWNMESQDLVIDSIKAD